MKNTLFHNKIENSHPIDFGTIFSNSIELFKKVWTQGIVHLLIAMVIVVPLSLLMQFVNMTIGIGTGMLSTFPVENGEMSGSELPLVGASVVLQMILTLLVTYVFTVPITAVILGINAHFFKTCKAVDLEEPLQTDYLMFFKGSGLKKIMLLAVITSAISTVATFLCYIPLLYVMVPIQLVGVIFAFNPELEVAEIIKSSFTLGNKLWLTIFGLMIVSWLVAGLGILACGVGLLFTLYFVYVPIYYVYKDAIGFDDDILNKDAEENTLLQS